MSGSRLSLALENGLFAFPAEQVAVWGRPDTSDLATLPGDARFVATFRPDFEALEEAGRTVATAPPAQAALGVVFIPREKQRARAILAEAVRVSTGPIVIDGQKTDGIEGLLRDLKRRAGLSPPLSKAHGKLAVLAAGAALDNWADPGPMEIAQGFVTRSGVFSADAPDPGSVLLEAALPADLGRRVADLGAGWGYLARAILARPSVEAVHLVEADQRALDCARLNAADPRATFHWADVARWSDAEGFDTIVTNPPFHASRAADPDLGRAFIAAAARLLTQRGRLWLVANRHLPYEKALEAAFGEVSEVAGDRSYKVFQASRPRKGRAKP